MSSKLDTTDEITVRCQVCNEKIPVDIKLDHQRHHKALKTLKYKDRKFFVHFAFYPKGPSFHVCQTNPMVKHFAVVVVWKTIHCGLDTNRTGAEGLSFYYPRLLCCLYQTLSVIVLSQHGVSSSNHQASLDLVLHVVPDMVLLERGLRYLQRRRTRNYLHMDEWNRPTPVRRRLSFTLVVWGKLNPIGLALVLGIKVRSLDVLPHHSVMHL